MPRLKYLWPALLLLLVELGPAQQRFEPGEVRLRTGAYHPRPAATIQARAELVEIGVVVRDSRGHAVAGLSKEDFEIRDENRRSEIAAFSVETSVPVRAPATQGAGSGGEAKPEAASSPRWVALVFDDVNSHPEDLYHARNAAKTFLDGGLASNDRVGVFTISRGTVLPFAADRAQIAAGIDGIRHFDHEIKSASSCPLLTAYDAYLIANQLDPMALDVKADEYKNCSGICGSRGGGRGRGETRACLEAVEAVQRISRTMWEEVRLQSQNSLRTLKNTMAMMARLPGARVILLGSSGFISGTLEPEEEEIISEALHANVVINSLDAKGLFVAGMEEEMGQGANARSATYRQLQGPTPKNAQNDALAVLADGTGGLFFHDNNDLRRGYIELGMQPEVSYMLAVTPEAADGKYHHLKVGLTGNRHLQIQARRGYVASGEIHQTPAAAPERRIDREVLSSDVLQEAPVLPSVRAAKADDGRQMAVLTLHVDVGAMQFQEQDGVRHQKLRVIGAVFDARDAFVTGVEATLEFALKETSYARFAKPGFSVDLPIQVPDGPFRWRTVVVEGEDDGRYTAKTETVEFK